MVPNFWKFVNNHINRNITCTEGQVLQVLRLCKRNVSCVITNFIQESLEKQLQNQRQHLEAKLLEQSKQFEAKLKQQGERFESQLKEHSEKQSEQFQEAVKQLSECHKVY